MEIRSGASQSGIVTVTDSITTVTSANTLTFVGATVTNGGSGNAVVTIPAGATYWTRNAGLGYLYPTTITDLLGLATNAPTHTLTMGSSSTGFALYNTADQTVNYERLLQSPSSNAYAWNSQSGGTGTARGFAWQANGTSIVTLNSTGTLTVPGSAGGNGRIILGTGTGINSRFALGTDGLGTGSNFGTSGFGLQIAAASYSSTSSTGTIATQGTHTFGIPTLAASNATTLTTASTLYIDGSPLAGSNVTITNPYALYVNGGTSFFNGLIGANGGISTNFPNPSATANFFSSGTSVISITNTSTTGLPFGGATNVSARIVFNGNTPSTLTASNSYANVIVGSSPVTAAATGTHAWLANQVINALGTVTNGSAIPITNTATLLIDGVSAAGTNNYALAVRSGNTILSNGSLTLATAGNKLNIATGSNASVGTATLSGGTVTVSTTAVTAASKIFLTDATTGALTNIGTPTVGTIVAGTSFVINSSNVLDTSNINWLIIN